MSGALSLLKGFKYACDTDNTYPWYDKDSCVTIEGPTDKHSMVRLQVSFQINMPYKSVECNKITLEKQKT